MLERTNYYACLGVSRNATQEEIREAYFTAARRYHPDTNPDPDTVETFLQVQAAYEVLSEPEKRLIYDAVLPPVQSAQSVVTLRTQYSRSSLPRINEPQLVYALVEIKPCQNASLPISPPLNLCLVLDRSTSMRGPRMDVVKATTIQLLQQMKPQDILSVVTFSDRAEVLVPPMRVGNLKRIENLLARLQCAGGTEIYHGLSLGVDQVRENLSPAFINHLLILTDGRTYGDEDKSLLLALQAAEDGIGISGVGIGHEWNDAFLDRIASCSGGSTIFVSDAKDLRNLLVRKCNTLTQVFAERVVLDVKPDDQIELSYAFRLEPESGPLECTSPIRVGSIPYDKVMRILLEFKLKELSQDVSKVTLADGWLKMDIPTQEFPAIKLKLNFELPVVDNFILQPVPAEILQVMSRLTLYRLQERARQEVSQGKSHKATEHLQYLATQLFSHGERNLAAAVQAEVKSISQNHHFSKEGEKRIKYGTRSLLLPPGPEVTR